MRASRAFLATAILSILQAGAFAAAVTPGNLVIYRVGNGAAALGTTATAVFLDEYTTGGSLVQSIALPTTGGGALTAVGNATTEGIISPSQDGTTLLFTGYRKAAGGTSPAGDSYTTTNRVIGTLTLTGTPDTATTLTSDGGATTANTIRSATSVNGTNGSAIWVSTSARIGYDSSGLGNSGGTTQIDARNSRQVNLANNTLYASNGSTSVTAKVQSYGNLPIAATTPSAVVTQASTDAVNGFILADLSASVVGADTLYAINTITNTLLKYSFNGTAWSASGTLTLASTAGTGAVNLVGLSNGGSVSLYLTSPGTLSLITDASGYGGTLAGTFSSLATAGTNTAFRGIGTLAAIPEASTAIFGCLVCMTFGLIHGARKYFGNRSVEV